MVEKIAREVIARLGSSGSSSGSSCSCESGSGGGSSRSASGQLLVVVTEGAVGIDEAIQQIQRARSNYSGLTLFIAVPKGSTIGDDFASRVSADRVLRCASGSSTDEALSTAAAVVYPLTTMTVAAKVGMLMTDSPSARLAVGAIMRRIPVVMATNALMTGLNHAGYTPPQFHDIGHDHLSKLSKLGVKTCDVREIASSLGSGAAAPSAGMSAARALPSSPAAGNSSYDASSAAVSCAPLAEDIKNFLQSTLADDPSCAPCAARVTEAIEKCIQAGACRIGTAGNGDAEAYVQDGMARMIDHTLLKPNVTPQEIEELCTEARRYHFKSVCINPGYVALSKRLLQGSGVLVCTVVGFPLGATTTSTKAAETRDAIADGADEIDMVINIGALKAGEYEKVRHDIEAVVEAARGRTVKVILETSFLNDEEKVAGCQLSVSGGAHFVKTSTGFGGGGATAEDIALMRRVVGPSIGVKASGGVRTKEDLEKMVAAGANRVGASASVSIVTGEKSESKGY